MNFIYDEAEQCGTWNFIVVTMGEAYALTGSIPNNIGNLTKLTILYLDINHLSGHIPRQLGYLENLEELGLCYNTLTGSIPNCLGNLTKLTTLDLESKPNFLDTSLEN